MGKGETCASTVDLEDGLKNMKLTSITVISDAEDKENLFAFEAAVDASPLVAVDSEWNMARNPPKDGPPLLQIGLADGSVYLFRVNKMNRKIPNIVLQILKDPCVLKVGVGVRKDFSFFPDLLDASKKPGPTGLVDLVRLALKLRPDLTHDSLAHIVKLFTGRAMRIKANRDERRAFLSTCNWESPDGLPQDLINYAANDVIATMEVTKVIIFELLNRPFDGQMNVTEKIGGDSSLAEQALRSWAGVMYKRSMLERKCTNCGNGKGKEHLCMPCEYWAAAKVKTNRKSVEVLLCRNCNAIWRTHVADLKNKLAAKYDAPFGKQEMSYYIIDPEKKTESRVSKYAAILKDENSLKSLSGRRFATCVLTIEEFFKAQHIAIEDALELAEKLPYKVPNPDYLKHAKTVMEKIKTSKDLIEFEDEWKDHFLMTMSGRAQLFQILD